MKGGATGYGGRATPAAGSHWGLGVKPQHLKIFQFFCNTNLILGLVWLRLLLLKRGVEISTAKT